MPNPYRAHGITLIEMLVMLAIIIILSTLGIPSLQNVIRNYRLSASTENLYYTLQYARTEAVKRNSNVYVSFVTGDSWCYGVNVGSSCTCTNPSSCSLGTASATSAQQLSLSATSYGSNYVYFEPTHGAANTSGTLTFTIYNSTTLVTIKVGQLGNLTMCSTGLSGYPSCS